MSAITLDPPTLASAHPVHVDASSGRALPSRLAFTTQVVPALAEALAITVTAWTLAGTGLAIVAALALLVRNLRTPVAYLLARPLAGGPRYLVDMFATFGVAVAIGGPSLAATASHWIAVCATGFAARSGVGVCRQVVRRLHPPARLRVLVLCDDETRATRLDALLSVRAFGIRPRTVVVPLDDPAAMRDAIESTAPDAVLIAHDDPSPALQQVLARLTLPVHVLVGRQRWPTGQTGRIETLWSERVLAVLPPPTRRPAWVLRTVLERTAALLAIVATAPVMVGMAIAVRVGSPGPVLFRQTRVGVDGREFTILKFRSMPVDHEADRWNAAHGAEPTGVGRIMRELSLDELPQLFNVLRGEMSLVGPRPELPRFVARFNESIEGYPDRHRVPVGMTGWAQVHGLRGETSLTDRVAFDNNYIDDWNLGRDLHVLIRTITQVLPDRFRAAPVVPVDDVIDLTDTRDSAVESPARPRGGYRPARAS